MNEENFDAIIIGSGIGGLTSASILAQLHGRRVLILERHFQLGGFTHTFTRPGGYEWDVGLHYVGEVGPGSVPGAVFDLVTGGGVTWNRMPEAYDRLRFPGLAFDIPAGRANLVQSLIANFPAEEVAIQRYFRDIDRAGRWLQRYFVSQSLTGGALWPLAKWARQPGAAHALQTTAGYLERNIDNPNLRAVLAGQWGLYGLPPRQSAFVGHALLAQHYMKGAYYPIGGAATIADSVIPIVESRGGAARARCAVEEILVENGRAVGVRAVEGTGSRRKEREFRAPCILSNAGARLTYTKLLPAEVTGGMNDFMATLPKGTANVTLYLGLKTDPRELGIEGENYWLYSGLDHDAGYNRRNALLDGVVSQAYLSFPSAKNPAAKAHTAEVIAFLDMEPFTQWRDGKWKRRGEDYEALKERISGALLDFVESHLSGFKAIIAYHELSTPLTTEHFTAHPGGAIYGAPMVPDKFHARWLSPSTPVRGLFLTGSDAASFGIVGAMMSGVLTAAVAVGKPWTVGATIAGAMKRAKRSRASATGPG